MSSDTTSSSASVAGGLLSPQNDRASISSFPTAGGGQSQELAEQVSAIGLNEDVPIPSIEGSSTDASGGVNIARGTDHSRTPSLSLTPPPANGAVTRDSPHGFGGGPASRGATSSIDGRLGMSEVAAAIEGVARGSNSGGALLHPQTPAVDDSSSHRRISRRRSSSRTNTARHNVADEDPPHDRFHEPTFQQAFSDAKRLMSELTNVLSSSPIHNDPDSTMRRLHEEAGNLSRFLCPSSRTVAFVGDSGVGKSSLLNSLLDFQDLARTSNSGHACTCVVTEFHYHDSNDFAIEVEWFSTDEIAAQLTELLQSYRHYYLHGADIDSEDRNDFEDRANIARDTFRAMFQERLEDERILTQSPEETILETLQSWARELRPSSTGHREVQNSLGDCFTLLEQLTSEQNSTQEPAKWPYIRKIRVFLKAHILSKGLVLVDLPGLRDLNSARQNITERYLLQCHEIFAVCSIGRATTDAGVMKVFELARQARLTNVGIVCTKSDDIRPEEAKRDWRGSRANIIQGFTDAIATDQRDMDIIEADLEDYGYDDDDDDLSAEEVEELRLLNRRLKQAKKRKENHEFERKEYLITTRNNYVRQTLNDKYRGQGPSNDVKVFCVSNTEYWKHRNLPKDDALCSLQLSGIISLRKHCISLVASSQLCIAMTYIQHNIPAVLGDIELWAQSGAASLDAERKEEMRITLNTLEARLTRELKGNSSWIGTIARSFKAMFRAQIFARRSIGNWTRAASDAAQEWSGWNHATYSAFCRNYGDHMTEAEGSHNWNEEAIEKMARDLATPWSDLNLSLQSTLEEYRGLTEDLMSWAIEHLDTAIQDSSPSASTLTEAMTSRQRLLVRDFEQACEKFQADLYALRTDALSGIRSSFMGQLMEESYRACIAEHGRNSDMRRKDIINRRLRDERVFESLQTSFKTQFNTLAEILQSDIQAAIATHLSVITNTLNIVRNENVALESERDPEFRGRVERKAREVLHDIHRLHGVIGS